MTQPPQADGLSILPGDTEALARRLQWMNLARLAAAVILMGGSLVLQEGAGFGGFTQIWLTRLIIATFTACLAFAILLQRRQWLNLLSTLQISWDLLLVTGLIALLGGLSSGFTFLYGVVILASALVVGGRSTVLTTIAAVSSYLAAGLSMAWDWLPTPPDQNEAIYELAGEALTLAILRNLVGFGLIGLLARTLTARLSSTHGRLREAKRRTAELAHLNEDILRSMTSGLLTTDLMGRIQVTNRAADQMLAADTEVLHGRFVHEVLPLQDLGPIAGSHRGFGQAERLDETHFPVGYNRSPLTDAKGRLLGNLMVFQDLSEIAELREKANRAERLASLGKLSAGLAHEIRNPLGSISGAVEMLRDTGELSSEDRQLLSLVLREVDRLNELVTTMLSVVRPIELNTMPVNLSELVNEIVNVANSGQTPTSRTIQYTLPTENVTVQGDPNQLRQLVWNLVKNAIHFSPADEAVRIVLERQRRAVILTVSDKGPGIATEDQEKLFDLFFSKRHQGVGLGLTLVKQIVDAHDATIRVESTPGEGAAFQVTFEAYADVSPSRSTSTTA